MTDRVDSAPPDPAPPPASNSAWRILLRIAVFMLGLPALLIILAKLWL